MTLLVFKIGEQEIATSTWTAKSEGDCVFVYYREAGDTRVSFLIDIDQFLGRFFAGVIDLRDIDLVGN